MPGTCARDRRALQQLALNVHVKHSDPTRPDLRDKSYISFRGMKWRVCGVPLSSPDCQFADCHLEGNTFASHTGQLSFHYTCDVDINTD